MMVFDYFRLFFSFHFVTYGVISCVIFTEQKGDMLKYIYQNNKNTNDFFIVNVCDSKNFYENLIKEIEAFILVRFIAT